MRRNLARLFFIGVIASAAALMAAPAATDRQSVDERDVSAAAVEQARVSTRGLRDEAAMVLVGSALIGLASAVRGA